MNSKKYVWKDSSCLGYITTSFKQNEHIDWKKIRADKTLKISVKERWHVFYHAYAYPNFSLGRYSSLKEAAIAINKKHKELFDSLKDCDILIIGDSDV